MKREYEREGSAPGISHFKHIEEEGEKVKLLLTLEIKQTNHTDEIRKRMALKKFLKRFESENYEFNGVMIQVKDVEEIK